VQDAFVGADDAADQVQSKAGAGGFGAEKWRENPLLLIEGDAGAIVGDDDLTIGCRAPYLVFREDPRNACL